MQKENIKRIAQYVRSDKYDLNKEYEPEAIRLWSELVDTFVNVLSNIQLTELEDKSNVVSKRNNKSDI